MISHYVLDVEFFDQIDCVARGSPLGLVMAIIFMCHFEVKWITQNNARHTIWFRHVDDISTLFKTKDSTIQLLQFLNDCHSNIKFIIKIEENDQIRFLHILLKHTSQHQFSTSFYRMNTSTGPYTKYDSFTYRKYNISFIHTLSFCCLSYLLVSSFFTIIT